MSVKFKPVGVIKTRLGIQQNGPAHKYFAQRCKDLMNDKYVPEKDGVLVNTSFINRECAIVYPAPYAHYQYEGIVYIDPVTGSTWGRKGEKKVPTDRKIEHYTKPGSGPYWDKQMKSVEIQNIEKEVQTYVRRGCK